MRLSLFALLALGSLLGFTSCRSGAPKPTTRLYEGDAPNVTITGQEKPGGTFLGH